MAWTPPKGVLRQRVRFERKGGVDNDGGIVKAASWSVLIAHRFCELLPQRGGEDVTAARISGEDVWILTVRSCTATRAVTTDDRVVELDSGQVFDVRSNLDLDGRGNWRVMTLQRGRGDGRQGA